jgi:hypothetical protein
MNWLMILQSVLVWLFGQGFIGVAVSWVADLPGLNKIKKGWKLFILLLLCLIASFLELVGTNVILITKLNPADLIDITGLGGLIFAGSQVWWKKIVKPMYPDPASIPTTYNDYSAKTVPLKETSVKSKTY